MLEELAEDQVCGRLATIYDEIRQTTRVPYVSSLQRHLATHPGLLEWAWAVLGSAFHEGRAQAVGWSVANSIALPSSQNAVDVNGLFGALAHADVSEEKGKVKNIYQSFIRVSPTNLVASCILKHRLAGDIDKAGREVATSNLPAAVSLPAMLDPLPPLADPATLSDEAQVALSNLGVIVAGKEFIPGLYRILANWPDYLVHVSKTLVAAAGKRQFDDVLRSLPISVDRLSLELERDCPMVAPPVAPGSEAARRLINVIDSYRVTSPEMVIYSKYLLQQLH